MIKLSKTEIRWLKSLAQYESDKWQENQIKRDGKYNETNDRRYQNLKSLIDRLYDTLDTDAKRIEITD